MARIPAPPQAVDTMSAAQLDRRRRVLDAVIELVAAGRVDDWGMKDVAERSGVALGTIYRYFSSKDHVAAAALLEWARTLDAGRAVRRTGSGTDRGRTGAGGRTAADSSGGDGSGGDGGPAPMADRLVAILRRAVRAYQQQPAFARLVMMTATSTDPFASECYAAMGASVYATLGEALDELEPDERRRVLDVVGAVWYQALIEWVNDRKTIAQVHEALESAARLVLAGYTPT